jgi:hypothetical protein
MRRKETHVESDESNEHKMWRDGGRDQTEIRWIDWVRQDMREIEVSEEMTYMRIENKEVQRFQINGTRVKE